MVIKRTINPVAQANRDLNELIIAILNKLEADDPDWAAALDQQIKDSRDRLLARTNRTLQSE